MCKYITFLFYAILNFIAVPCAFSQAAQAGKTINLIGRVINPPQCIVNSGNVLNISFNAISSDKIGHSSYYILAPNKKYGTVFSIPIFCSGLKPSGFKMSLSGDISNIGLSTFDRFLFGSNKANLSLIIQKKGSGGEYSGYPKNSTINIPFFSGSSSIDFMSFLVKSKDTLPSGEFTVTISVISRYE